MAGPRDLPGDQGAEAGRRLVRSFLVVRLVRGGLMLVFLAVALVGVEVRDWPRTLSVAIVLAMLLLAGALIDSHRRYRSGVASAGRPPRRGSAQT